MILQALKLSARIVSIYVRQKNWLKQSWQGVSSHQIEYTSIWLNYLQQLNYVFFFWAALETWSDHSLASAAVRCEINCCHGNWPDSPNSPPTSSLFNNCEIYINFKHVKPHNNIKHNNIVNLPWYTSWWYTGCTYIL